MGKFYVLVREVHISMIEVEADDPSDAIDAVKGGNGDEVSFEYSHTLDAETWSVDDSDGNEVREQYPKPMNESTS